MTRNPAWADLDDAAPQIYVKLETGRVLVLDITRMRAVGDLRRVLARRLGVGLYDFWLYYRRSLRNHHRLRYLGIREGVTIELFSARSGILGV